MYAKKTKNHFLKKHAKKGKNAKKKMHKMAEDVIIFTITSFKYLVTPIRIWVHTVDVVILGIEINDEFYGSEDLKKLCNEYKIDFDNIDPLATIKFKKSKYNECWIGTIEFIRKSRKSDGPYGEENNPNEDVVVTLPDRFQWTQIHVELDENDLPTNIEYKGIIK